MKLRKLVLLASFACVSILSINSYNAKADTTSASQVKTTQQTQLSNQESLTKQTENTKKIITTKNGSRYYLKNNKPVKGLKKIDNSWYLFNKNGKMLTNVHKIPHQNNYGYFAKDGKRKFSNTSTGKAYYWINKTGNITGIKNNAKVISQLPEMPTGCEITAVTMMINFAGKNITKQQAAKIMPRSGNPNRGFVGNPYRKYPYGYWVAPNGVKPVVKHYLGTALNMTNCSLTAIKRKLIYSHLVVIWVGDFDGISNHAIALTGYHNKTWYYNDPWTGTKRSMRESTLLNHWSKDKYRALSY